MFNIVLVHPEIPPNTGNIIRLAANTGCALHLIEPLGFMMEDRLLRRAGLDYAECARVQSFKSWSVWQETSKADPNRLFALTSKGSQPFASVKFEPGDSFIFGCETAGLPPGVVQSFAINRRVRLPMRPQQRSLNLSNSVSVVVYEAWRQNGYCGAV
jgi:tRNA (cytidine/uridine-2'-O-)-methyltransferase